MEMGILMLHLLVGNGIDLAAHAISSNGKQSATGGGVHFMDSAVAVKGSVVDMDVDAKGDWSIVGDRMRPMMRARRHKDADGLNNDVAPKPRLSIVEKTQLKKIRLDELNVEKPNVENEYKQLLSVADGKWFLDGVDTCVAAGADSGAACDSKSRICSGNGATLGDMAAQTSMVREALRNGGVHLQCPCTWHQFWCNIFLETGLSQHQARHLQMQGSVWEFAGIDTCVFNGNHNDLCDSAQFFCPGEGGNKGGFSGQRAAAVKEALDNGGVHPRCPRICTWNDYWCGKALPEVGIRAEHAARMRIANGEFMLDGMGTCVCASNFHDACNSSEMVCLGEGTCGFSKARAAALKKAMDHGGIHPDCPSMHSRMWQSFVAGQGPLPDFSYAGYMHGSVPIPELVEGSFETAFFNVVDYGARADDQIDDLPAIRKAIRAASKHCQSSTSKACRAVVKLPAGTLIVDAKNGVPGHPLIRIVRKGIYLKGAGDGLVGTVLQMVNGPVPCTSPEKLWSGPPMIMFGIFGSRQNLLTPLRKNVVPAKIGSHSVRVYDASRVRAGQLVALRQKGSLHPFLLQRMLRKQDAPRRMPPQKWRIMKTGININEIHRVRSVEGDIVTFVEPLYVEVNPAEGQWELTDTSYTENVGVEDIHFVGGWTGNGEPAFAHHRSQLDDSGWHALRFSYTSNSYVRRCTFTNWNWAMSLRSVTSSILDIALYGTPGHTALSIGWSAYVLVKHVTDRAGHWHAPGFCAGTMGSVITQSEIGARSFHDIHGSQAYSNLFDDIRGGAELGHLGGHPNDLPHHLYPLIFWNFELIHGHRFNLPAGLLNLPSDCTLRRPDWKCARAFKWMSSQARLRAQDQCATFGELWYQTRNLDSIVPVILVGAHSDCYGHNQPLWKDSMWAHGTGFGPAFTEGVGRKMFPSSLYEAQLMRRLET